MKDFLEAAELFGEQYRRLHCPRMKKPRALLVAAPGVVTWPVAQLPLATASTGPAASLYSET